MNNPFEALAGLKANLPEGDDIPAQSDKVHHDRTSIRAATLFYESKGRNGKEATIIEINGDADETEMKELASDLKRRLATGGSVRGNEILLQGDRRTQARGILVKMGFRVKG